jgi:hypothetical protein
MAASSARANATKLAAINEAQQAVVQDFIA